MQLYIVRMQEFEIARYEGDKKRKNSYVGCIRCGFIVFSEFTHWRSKPEQSITLQEDELANYEKKRKISAQRKKADSKK